MDAKQEMDFSAQPSFVPYKITIEDCKTIETFEQVITKIFAIPKDIKSKKSNTALTTETEEVNEWFLVKLAHGIQGVEQYDAQHTPEEIIKLVGKIAEQFPSRKKACQFFLNHFEKISQYHNPKVFNSSASNNLERITPEYSKNILPFGSIKTIRNNTNHHAKKIKKHRLIEAMCHDLKLLHLINLMRLHSDYIELGKHIPGENILGARFNQLSKLISTDIVSSKSDQKLLRKKFRMYLAVANELLQDKSIIDFEGAVIINFALQLHVDLLKDNHFLKRDITKLADCLDFKGNFAVLRKKIETTNCVPFFPLISKDLTFIKENVFWDTIFFIGKQYHALSQRISILREEARRQGIFQPIYQTNLCTILDGCSLFWSASPGKITDPDSLPTLTCKAYILSKETLFYWDKINNVHEEQDIKKDDLITLTMKLKTSNQLLNSARLLSSRELKSIAFCTSSIPKELPIELKISRQSSSSLKNSKKTLRHSIAITPTSPTIQFVSTAHGHSAPKISSKQSVNDKKSLSRKRTSRKMTTNNYERKPLNLETIEEKQKILDTGVTSRKELSHTILRDAIIEHGVFSVPKPKHRKHHSEPLLKASSENLGEQSEPGDEGSKLTLS